MTEVLQEVIEQAAGIDANGYPGSIDPSIPKITELLDHRRFDATKPPPPLRAVYTLAGHIIATPGNLVAITATIKTGKSAVIGAMMAAGMASNSDVDLLGFYSTNPTSLALLHFDSEQPPDDFWQGVNRSLKRGGLREPPPWLCSYCLTGLGFKLGWECVTKATQAAAEQHGGIHSILIDGVADLVLDVNDPAESNYFVAELHAMAIKFNCPIVGVIHFNPGGDKVRGHLGSQLERKAETNLRLDKTDGVTTLWSDKQRRAPIPKASGPCFAWSDEAEMHVSVQTQVAAKDQIEKESLGELFSEVFSDRPSMRYSDLQVTVKKRLTVSEKTAERKVMRAVKLGVITKSVAGLYIKGFL